METGLVYKNSLLYELAMLVLYGRHYFSRSRVIADLIPEGASVLDVCCGPPILYRRYLRPKQVQYTGLDLNPKFIAQLHRYGAQGLVCDLKQEQALPSADYVIMQASLYHFLPDAAAVVDRMLRAARRQVIIAEPIRNLAQSRIPVLAGFARRHSNPGKGDHVHRFTEQTLDELFAGYSTNLQRSFLIPGGREKVYLLNAHPTLASVG
jgi:SAM-dependent methyltransferase